jgi:large subunit ribosomal protein L21
MFAVIRTGGKQYRVAADQVITVDKLAGAPGERVEFADVLVVGGDEVALGAPTVAGATVAGEVVEQGRTATIIAFKKRRRQNSRRKRGHRQEFTRVRIIEILTDGRKPAPAETQAQAAPAVEQSAGAESSAAAQAAPAEAKPAKSRTRSAKAKAPQDDSGSNKS